MCISSSLLIPLSLSFFVFLPYILNNRIAFSHRSILFPRMEFVCCHSIHSHIPMCYHFFPPSSRDRSPGYHYIFALYAYTCAARTHTHTQHWSRLVRKKHLLHNATKRDKFPTLSLPSLEKKSFGIKIWSNNFPNILFFFFCFASLMFTTFYGY